MIGRDELIATTGILQHERAFLEGLTAILPEGARVVNIGAFTGSSAVAMLRGGRDIEDFHLWSIDIEPCPREMEYAEACGLADSQRFMQILGDSKVVGKRWLTKVDLVFIDGDHTYEGCKGDIDAWEPHVAEGGYLVLHDYEGPTDIGLVTQAVNDWFGEARKRGWIKVAKVDISVAFQRDGLRPRPFSEALASRLLSHWLGMYPDTITGKFMRGEE